ncbi:MAG: NTP transferase domain-containing protein [Kordiimonas sp.]
MSLAPVCILTAGIGSRMGALGDVVNKALLPLGDKAIISHIIESFPKGTEFVIATGYKKEQVKAYLRMAHRDVEFTFCDVENFAGAGSGPGLSLLACQDKLKRPFYFCPSDSLIEVDLSNTPDNNWIALGKETASHPEAYCNMKVSEGIVSDIADKQFPSPDYKHFTGLLFIKDHDVFWKHLLSNELKAGERQVSNGIAGLVHEKSLDAVQTDWSDLGDYSSYKAALEQYVDFDFTKKDEFLYICNDVVIKFFADPDIIKKRTEKSLVHPDVFPKIFDVDDQFYAYELIPGDTVYRVNSPEIFASLLKWLDEKVWTSYPCSEETIQSLCTKFYKDKTLARLAAFYAKYPKYQQPAYFNGEPILPLRSLLDKVNWDLLADGVPTFMHGDLQFDNIIYNSEAEEFTLIDWRQDFAGEVVFGDIYYDLAKMLGGIWLNYDYIKRGLFSVNIEEDHIDVDLTPDPLSETLEKMLAEYIQQKGLDLDKVKLLVGIIFLNMSPLHETPFDEMLHALGRSVVQKAIGAGG